jgi:hypothetical protein
MIFAHLMKTLSRRISRSFEVDVVERQRQRPIVDDERIEPVLALCAQNMRAGVKSQTFDIPRWLTLEEFQAVRRRMLEQGWEVKYTFPSRFRDRPQLCIVPIDDWNEN